jgi:hypothetical protein
MENKKKPRSREINGTLHTPWFSRDGKTVIPPEAIPEHPECQVHGPLTRLRFVDVQDGQYVFELPQHPELPPIRLDLKRDLTRRPKEDYP